MLLLLLLECRESDWEAIVGERWDSTAIDVLASLPAHHSPIYQLWRGPFILPRSGFAPLVPLLEVPDSARQVGGGVVGQSCQELPRVARLAPIVLLKA